MSDVILYDNLSQPVTNEDASLQNGQYAAFSFMTGAAGGTLDDVKLTLVDATPSDGGSVAVQLYTASSPGDVVDGPNTKVADLGLVSDASLNFSTNPTDVPITGNVTLAPNTQYFIKMTGVLGSKAVVGATDASNTSGTGVAGQQSVYQTSPTSTSYGFTNDIAQVTENVTCFVTGTMIRTLRGDVAVEDLHVGDTAVTASGDIRPITWIGHRDLDGGVEPLPYHQQSICVRAGAFGPDLPVRDLHLSPGHPVLVGANDDSKGGYLVPIMCLVNGVSIVRASVREVTYWHVELDQHDILLAEGLPAESYLDCGDRPFFTEGADHALANPDFVVPDLSGRCRPVAVDGPVIEAERRRLDRVLTRRLASAAAWPTIQRDFLAIF